MTVFEGRQIMDKLTTGLRRGIAARFGRMELPLIDNLIETSMVNPAAFVRGPHGDWDHQNLSVLVPVTELGQQTFRWSSRYDA